MALTLLPQLHVLLLLYSMGTLVCCEDLEAAYFRLVVKPGGIEIVSFERSVENSRISPKFPSCLAWGGANTQTQEFYAFDGQVMRSVYFGSERDQYYSVCNVTVEGILPPIPFRGGMVWVDSLQRVLISGFGEVVYGHRGNMVVGQLWQYDPVTCSLSYFDHWNGVNPVYDPKRNWLFGFRNDIDSRLGAYLLETYDLNTGINMTYEYSHRLIPYWYAVLFYFDPYNDRLLLQTLDEYVFEFDLTSVYNHSDIPPSFIRLPYKLHQPYDKYHSIGQSGVYFAILNYNTTETRLLRDTRLATPCGTPTHTGCLSYSMFMPTTPYPTEPPTQPPTLAPSTASPTTTAPTRQPSFPPTLSPTRQPTRPPTITPSTPPPTTGVPTLSPSLSPTSALSIAPKMSPTNQPAHMQPTVIPTTSSPISPPSAPIHVPLAMLTQAPSTTSSTIGTIGRDIGIGLSVAAAIVFLLVSIAGVLFVGKKMLREKIEKVDIYEL